MLNCYLRIRRMFERLDLLEYGIVVIPIATATVAALTPLGGHVSQVLFSLVSVV